MKDSELNWTAASILRIQCALDFLFTVILIRRCRSQIFHIVRSLEDSISFIYVMILFHILVKGQGI
jgi:hypothetical protein